MQLHAVNCNSGENIDGVATDVDVPELDTESRELADLHLGAAIRVGSESRQNLYVVSLNKQAHRFCQVTNMFKYYVRG